MAFKTSDPKILSLLTHELRAPVHTINGYLDLALSGVAGDLEPELASFLRRARSSSEHLFTMLENLLLLARADSNQLRLRRDVIAISDLLTDVLEGLEISASEKALSLDVEVSPAFPAFYADAERLQQLVRNLLSNALRFTDEGGKVLLKCWFEQKNEQNLFYLLVSDNGPGIPSEQQERIFERFFRCQSGGPGLGLAVARLLAELHGGTITVKSEPGNGSSFLCVFPVLLAE